MIDKPFISQMYHLYVAPYFLAPSLALLWILGLWLVKRILIRRLAKMAARTTAFWDDLLIEALAFPLNFLIIASGVAIFAQMLSLPEKADHLASLALRACFVFSGIFFLDRLARGFMARKESSAVFGQVSYGIVKGLIRGFVIGIGALVLLDLFGVSITPILASLGVGSLAVALALQDTLSNFFAGLYVTVDRPVTVGDFIKLESGQEGYVEEVGWRSTRVRMLSNNVVILPNTKLMGSVITNYYLPMKQMGMTVDVSVHYDSDLEKVDRVTCEVARQVMKTVPGGIPDFEPFIRFHTLGDSAVQFSVIMQVKEFTDNYLIKHEFIRALVARYRQEGIVIPYPTRTVGLGADSVRLMKDILSVPSK